MVTGLEEAWGEYLVQQRQLDQAVDHFLQAGIFNKAIESALQARNWNRAVQLVGTKPADQVRPYQIQIARHYAEIRKYDQAEKFFIKGGEYVEAFEMYVRANKWDKANQLILHHLPESQQRPIQVQEAQNLRLREITRLLRRCISLQVSLI
jgi:intraflagellar transport protein 172